MKKCVVIYNPNSGKGISEKNLLKIENVLYDIPSFAWPKLFLNIGCVFVSDVVKGTIKKLKMHCTTSLVLLGVPCHKVAGRVFHRSVTLGLLSGNFAPCGGSPSQSFGRRFHTLTQF
jgi:hypothetical protein